MSTYTQILYQIVFSTKNRIPCMNKQNRTDLFKYLGGVLKNKNCHLYQLNGVEDHLHIVTHIHPSIALARLIKDIKKAGTEYIKTYNLFNNFPGWQAGYGAFTYSIDAKTNLINYVKNQEQHHKKTTYKSELIKLLAEHQIEYDEKYLL